MHPNIEDYTFPQDERLDKEFAMPTVVANLVNGADEV